MCKKNINKLVICELSYYAPTFYGNFMASLFDLELKLKNLNNVVVNGQRKWYKKIKIYFS